MAIMRQNEDIKGHLLNRSRTKRKLIASLIIFTQQSQKIFNVSQQHFLHGHTPQWSWSKAILWDSWAIQPIGLRMVYVEPSEDGKQKQQKAYYQEDDGEGFG